MALDCSFGDKGGEEEIDLKTLAKIKDQELTIENLINEGESETEPNNNQIFNQVSTKEINNREDINQLEYYQTLLIQENINLSLKTIFSIINSHILINKKYLFHKLKSILNKKYSNLVTIQILYMNIKNKFKNLLFLAKYIEYKIVQKAFYNIKRYAYLKIRQTQGEQNIKREKDNKINVLNGKLGGLNKTINETNKRINGLESIQNKLNGENKDIKNKISQMNEKVNQLIKYGNNLRENINNKKNINNNINGKNQENRIQNLKILIEQTENEKEREMKEIDKFCENMDLVLNQYEAMSETILSNSNIHSNK